MNRGGCGERREEKEEYLPQMKIRWTQINQNEIPCISSVSIGLHLWQMCFSLRPGRSLAKRAVHPGDILQEMLDEKGVSQSRLARHLRTDVARINEICRRRRGISAEMAVKLAKAFGTSQGLWMNLQKNWELSQVDPRTATSVRPLRASA